MWRRNAYRVGNNEQENHDSDQSISEEEEGLDGEWKGSTISPGGGQNNKGTMQVLSQLDILRESYELPSTEKEPISSHGKKGGYHIEDEVEIPIFNDGDGPSRCHRIGSATLAHSNDQIISLPAAASITYSDEEIISDDEIQKINPHTVRSARENSGGMWSGANHEMEAFVRLNKKSSHSSHHNVFVKEKKFAPGGGGRKKAKPKFLFPSHSHKDLCLVVKDSNQRASSKNAPLADEIDAAADDDMDNYVAESQLNFRDKESEQPENQIVPSEVAQKYDIRGHSMADFLNGFLERSNLEQGSSELGIRKKRRRLQTVLERNMSPLGDRILDDDDLPEALDSGAPFRSEDEDNARSIKSIICRNMAEKFHEAFGAVSVIDDRPPVAFPGPLCSGLYRKLQQVMQSEKERDMNSLKIAIVESGFKDEGMSILVRILSRSLEAKLIVCSCTPVADGKDNNLEMKMKGVARTLTIIFNPRMCSDVDLEVGNLIRMHPPWKEVQVKDEAIFLCLYFAQVQP